jgi:hypothetical protein
MPVPHRLRAPEKYREPNSADVGVSTASPLEKARLPARSGPPRIGGTATATTMTTTKTTTNKLRLYGRGARNAERWERLTHGNGLGVSYRNATRF